ncbi:MAG TPA: hypothetical protein VMT46_04890 [Anaerolineaceae bacterium]|nr:hypothetical protein [Anaerolineaceae bacterium]
MKKTTLILLCLGIAALASGLMALNPLPEPAAASSPTRTPRAGQQAEQELTFTLQREQNWLERQKIHLTQADQLAAKAQTLIDQAQAKGLDVTDLKNALETFKAQVAAALASHDQAASILSAKNGFDGNNQVTDRQAAHQTVLDARNALRQAHLTLQGAVLNFRSAIQNWRIAHKTK